MQHVLQKTEKYLAGETITFTPDDNEVLDDFIDNNIILKISKKFMDNELFIYSAENYEDRESYTSYGLVKISGNHHDNILNLSKEQFRSMVDGDAFSSDMTKTIRCYYNQTYIDFIFSKTQQLIKAKVYEDEIPDWCEDLRV